MYDMTIEQVARAMETEPGTLEGLLAKCGVQPSEGRISRQDLQLLETYLESVQEENRQRAQEKLERQVQQCVLLVDTCSLLSNQFPTLMGRLAPLLYQCGKALIVPSGVVAELQGLAVKKPELTERICEIVRQLAAMKAEGLVKVCGDAGESFCDRQMLAVATRMMTNSKLLVITQDKGLSEDLLHLNQLNSVRGKRLEVGRINRYGYLSRYIPEEQRFAGSDSRSNWGSFSRDAALVEEDTTRIPVDGVPAEGETVWGVGGPVLLGQELSSGGEGTIYDLGDGTVAKLYRPGKLTVGRRNKLALMTAQQVHIPGVCWPQELLYDGEGNFVGYRMEKAGGKELQRCVFNRVILERCFPAWTKTDTVRLCVTILEKICALHRQGIILGDINPLNILVESPEKVWLVDCDSYQIGGYPCPVGTVRFTAPEIQDKSFPTFLRTPGNEAFAVATLLFMIMLPGKSPYAQQGGDDLAEVIKAMNFPYPCGDNRSDKTPEGGWRFQWSHLPRYLKEYFYGTFQRGGDYSREEDRLSPEKWLSAFRHYHELLAEGKLQEQDPESGLIFPTRWKIADPAKRTVWKSCVCSDCGSPFDITEEQRGFYEARGYELPRRCPACRRLRKLASTGSLAGMAS